MPRAASSATHSGATHTERLATRSCTNAVARAHMGVSPFALICSCTRQPRLTRPHRHQVLGRHIYFCGKKAVAKARAKNYIGANIFWHAKDSAGETISAVRLGLVTQLLRLMRAHIDLILFASCVFTIYIHIDILLLRCCALPAACCVLRDTRKGSQKDRARMQLRGHT